jgi:hypothetical protein
MNTRRAAAFCRKNSRALSTRPRSTFASFVLITV